jgi:hypothetical protein
MADQRNAVRQQRGSDQRGVADPAAGLGAPPCCTIVAGAEPHLAELAVIAVAQTRGAHHAEIGEAGDVELQPGSNLPVGRRRRPLAARQKACCQRERPTEFHLAASCAAGWCFAVQACTKVSKAAVASGRETK